MGRKKSTTSLEERKIKKLEYLKKYQRRKTLEKPKKVIRSAEERIKINKDRALARYYKKKQQEQQEILEIEEPEYAYLDILSKFDRSAYPPVTNYKIIDVKTKKEV